VAQQEQGAPSEAWARVKSRLRAELGEDVFASWFRGVELEGADGEVLHLTVATRFLRNWLRSHYYDFVLRLARAEWPDVERVEFRVRQPHFGGEAPKEALRQRRLPSPAMPEAVGLPMPLRTGSGGFEGSPLDPRLTFTSFLVGVSNRLAHAAAQEVAQAFAKLPHVTKAVVGLGLWAKGQSTLYDSLARDEREALAAQGIFAEVAGVFVSETGEPVTTELAERMIGITHAQLRAIPQVIAIAYGNAKAPAVRAVLRSGLIVGLVTHTSLAQALLDET